MPRTRNRRTGVTDETPQHLIDHEVLGADLELIGDDEKPFVPELIAPKHIAPSDNKRSDKKEQE